MATARHTGSELTWRLDRGTFLGLLVAVGCILGGLVIEGGKVSDLAQAAAGLMVFGGTLGAVLVTTPVGTFRSAFRRLSEVLIVRSQPFEPALESLLRCAERARKNGVSCLEFEASQTADSFFQKGLNLAADGAEPSQLREMMLLELDSEEEQSEAEAKVWESAAGYSPTVGIMGAVLGLIQVLKHLDNVNEVGRGIAVAFVATVYGVAAANLLFLPVAGKLRARSREIERLHEMMLEGLLGVVEGMNPTLLRIKLSAFLSDNPAAGTRKPARENAQLPEMAAALAE